MKRGNAQKRVIQQIKRIMRLKDGTRIRFELDYLKLKHPQVFGDCVARVLNEFGRNGMLGLDGFTGQGQTGPRIEPG